MKPAKLMVVVMLAAIQVLTLRGQGQRETLAWAPVPATANGWVAPNKPHTKLADLTAAHKEPAAWRETVVRQPAAGTCRWRRAETPRRSIPTTRSGGSCRAARCASRSRAGTVRRDRFLCRCRIATSIRSGGGQRTSALRSDGRELADDVSADETPAPQPGTDFVKVISGKANTPTPSGRSSISARWWPPAVRAARRSSAIRARSPTSSRHAAGRREGGDS